jgi:hypothetical protein
MDNIAQIEILKIVQHILWLVSAFWFGYEIGKQHICTRLIEDDRKLIEKDKKQIHSILQQFNKKGDK